MPSRRINPFLFFINTFHYANPQRELIEALRETGVRYSETVVVQKV